MLSVRPFLLESANRPRFLAQGLTMNTDWGIQTTLSDLQYQQLQGETGVWAGKPACRERKKRECGILGLNDFSAIATDTPGMRCHQGHGVLQMQDGSDAIAANLVPNLLTSVHRFGITHHGQGRNRWIFASNDT